MTCLHAGVDDVGGLGAVLRRHGVGGIVKTLVALGRHAWHRATRHCATLKSFFISQLAKCVTVLFSEGQQNMYIPKKRFY